MLSEKEQVEMSRNKVLMLLGIGALVGIGFLASGNIPSIKNAMADSGEKQEQKEDSRMTISEEQKAQSILNCPFWVLTNKGIACVQGE